MERCRSHPVWEARTDFGSVGVIDDADQMPTTPRHRGGRCESGLSEIKRFGVGASLFERNENRVHISDALLISPECPVPAGASRPAGTPVPSAQLLEPHSSASRQCLLHCVHHGFGELILLPRPRAARLLEKIGASLTEESAHFGFGLTQIISPWENQKDAHLKMKHDDGALFN